MTVLVLGGSGSGKSAFAEVLCMSEFSCPRYYVATMKVYGQEGLLKVERHRKLRDGKGFITIEKTSDVGELFFPVEAGGNGDAALAACASHGAAGHEPAEGTVLLECLSNLVANEMFNDDGTMVPADEVAEKVLRDLELLSRKVRNLVIVSSNVFEDGICYDDGTMAYIKALGAVNTGLAGTACQVHEVVAGIPVRIR